METRIADRQDAAKATSKAAKKQAKRTRIEASVQDGAHRIDILAGLSAAIDARNHAKAFAAAVASGDDQGAKAALDRTLTKLAEAARARGWGNDA